MAKKAITKKENKKIEWRVGDTVTFTDPSYGQIGSNMYPHANTKYACEGVISDVRTPSRGEYSMLSDDHKISKDIPIYLLNVDWDNGHRGIYLSTSVEKLTSNVVSQPVSFKSRASIKINNVEVIKKGQNLFIEGQFAMNRKGTIMLDAYESTHEQVFPKEILQKIRE